MVAWTDGYATAERALRRAGLAHFGLRAVLRVLSPAESDSLLGVSAAASLDDDRALYRDTEWPAEQVEKFKPHSVASLYSFALLCYSFSQSVMAYAGRHLAAHVGLPINSLVRSEPWIVVEALAYRGWRVPIMPTFVCPQGSRKFFMKMSVSEVE